MHVEGIMATRDLRSYFMSKSKKKKNSHKGIPDLVKATGMLPLLMCALLMVNWRASVRKKVDSARYTVLIYLLERMRKLVNMYSATEHKLPLNTLSQSTHNTFLYVLLLIVENVSSITNGRCVTTEVQ